LEMASLRLPGGRSRTLVANVYPANATINAVLWSSDNPAVAMVDAVTGQITAVSEGRARITAVALNGGERAVAEVEVVPGLPSLHLSIEPYERGGPNSLDRNIWRNTTVSLRGAGPYAGFAFEGMSAQARGRGNSSWIGFVKRPLRIRFDTARSMFGSDYAARDWTLIANANDRAVVRNYSAYFMGSLMEGLDFSPSGHFLHLYMDGEYRGVYMLSDQMQIHQGRVELSQHPDPALSEYFLELDGHAVRSGETFFWAHGRPFRIAFPDTNAGSGHWEFARGFIYDVFDALHAGDYDEISRIIDIDSFVDAYLVIEFLKDIDLGSSQFFQIRRSPNSKLFAGPLWDFDGSLGSPAPWYNPSPPVGDFAAQRHPFFGLLMITPWFREMVRVRWLEVTAEGAQVQTLFEEIRRITTAYQACFEHNFNRWPGVGWSPPGLHEAPFIEHVEWMTTWLERRKVWMGEFLQEWDNLPKPLSYRSHAAGRGWLGIVAMGETSGTIGERRPIEAIQLHLRGILDGSNIEIDVYAAGLGWMGWRASGQIAGTAGQARPLEAIRVRLVGPMAEQFDVAYRVHTIGVGWSPWVTNGTDAGTAGESQMIEAVQIYLQER